MLGSSARNRGLSFLPRLLLLPGITPSLERCNRVASDFTCLVRMNKITHLPSMMGCRTGRPRQLVFIGTTESPPLSQAAFNPSSSHFISNIPLLGHPIVLLAVVFREERGRFVVLFTFSGIYSSSSPFFRIDFLSRFRFIPRSALASKVKADVAIR